MASPQTDDGYTRVANELAEALYRYPFSGQESRVVMYVLRTIYGWKGRKETPPVSVRLMGGHLHMHPSTVSWVLRGLLARGVVFRTPNNGLRLNKNYEEWLPRRVSRQLALTSSAKLPANKPGDPPPPGTKKSIKQIDKSARPTLTEVQEYATERKSPVDPEKFWNHYESVDWTSGNKSITNWKASFCYWERTEHGEPKKKPSGPKCPLCDEPMSSANTICCDRCRAFCRLCGRDIAQLRVYKRQDGTKSLRCKVKCENQEDESNDLARAAVPAATRKIDQDQLERFEAARRQRQAAQEKK